MEQDYNNRASKLQSELEDQKVKEVIRLEITTAHGKILNPDVPNRGAFIDIGSRDRVVPGLKFIVAKRGSQGKFEFKGKIVVKKVWMTYAEVAITDLYTHEFPIVDGDLILNPLFHRQRPVVVHLLGEREPRLLRPNWNFNEASRRIIEIGSEVREKLTLDVDFIIRTEVGKSGSWDNVDGFSLAVLLGLPIEEASEIFKFLED
jgi:hypothetical protein